MDLVPLAQGDRRSGRGNRLWLVRKRVGQASRESEGRGQTDEHQATEALRRGRAVAVSRGKANGGHVHGPALEPGQLVEYRRRQVRAGAGGGERFESALHIIRVHRGSSPSRSRARLSVSSA